jgi:hypothetical protein
MSLTSTNSPPKEAKVIDFPTADILQLKRLDEIDWDKSQEWDMGLGKPHGVVGDNGYRDINGPTPEYPEGVLTRAQEGETNDLARYKEPIDKLLVEREKTHGPYKVKAKIIQDLKCAMELTEGWDNLNDMQRESLHMIAHKIGRILSGNPNCADHWDDVAGYARLVSKSL